MNDDVLLSIPEAAKRLGVSETIVKRLLNRGELTPAKVELRGKQVRRWFRAVDVDWLRHRREGSTAEG